MWHRVVWETGANISEEHAISMYTVDPEYRDHTFLQICGIRPFYCITRRHSLEGRNNDVFLWTFIIIIIISGVGLSPLGTAATSGLLYKPQMIDECDCGAIGGMKIGRGNRRTWRKPAPAPLCQPQIWTLVLLRSRVECHCQTSHIMYWKLQLTRAVKSILNVLTYIHKYINFTRSAWLVFYIFAFTSRQFSCLKLQCMKSNLNRDRNQNWGKPAGY
jgi:hypothetical protein